MLTKEQKQAAIDALSYPYGFVKLICDGYEIALVVEKSNKLTYRIVTYINGMLKGEWVSGTAEHPEQRFLNRKERPLASPKEKAKFEKAFGKRATAKDPWFSKTIVTYDISWASGRSAINHLCRVSKSIELVEKEGAL